MHSGPAEGAAGTSAASALSSVGSSVGKYPFLTVAGEPRKHEGHGISWQVMNWGGCAGVHVRCENSATASSGWRGMRLTGVRRRARRCGSGRPAPGSASARRWRAGDLPGAEGERQAGQHRLRLQQLQHAIAPGSRSGSGRCPAPASTAGRAGAWNRAAGAPARWRWPCRA